MTDLPYILHIDFCKYRWLPLSYYIECIEKDMRGKIPEAQMKIMLDQLQRFADADIPLREGYYEHGFCCRVLKMKCKCPWIQSVYPIFDKIVATVKDGVSVRCKVGSDQRDVVTWYKPLQSGLYEWTQHDYGWNTVNTGLASGTMENGHLHVQQY